MAGLPRRLCVSLIFLRVLAVGLIAKGNDGRVVQLGLWPDDLTGLQTLAVINESTWKFEKWEPTGSSRREWLMSASARGQTIATIELSCSFRRTKEHGREKNQFHLFSASGEPSQTWSE
jgi:hypothetical protein